MAGINYEITGDNSNFLQKMQQVRSSMSQTTQTITREGASIDNMFSKLAQSAAAFGAGFSAVSFAKQVAMTRGEFQKLEASFTTLLGSKEKSDEMMADMMRLAATTPFDLKGVADGAKQLLSYGTASKDVEDTLRRLGDIAAGLDIQLGDLTYLYGTTMTQGRLNTADLNQFTGRGIPMIQELAKQFGVAEGEVKKLVEEGKVGFPEVQKVIMSLTNEGGKFGGLMEAQSKTISGQIANIEDAIDSMFNNIGKQNEGLISDVLSGVGYLVENYEAVGKAIAEIAVAYGTIKAVYASYVALQKVGIKTELQGYESLLSATQDYGDEQVNQLARSGKINAEQATRLAQLKAEAKARLESAQASARAAQIEYQSAIQANITARERVASAQATLAVERQRLASAQASGNQEAILTAQRRVNTAETNLNTASQQANTTQRNLSSAATARQTTQTQVNTIQQRLNTISMTSGSKALQLFTVAQRTLGKVMQATGLSMLANPYILATAAIVGAGYALYKFITYETEAEKSTRRLTDAQLEAQVKIDDETKALEELCEGIDKANKGTDEYAETKEDIISKYAKYHENLAEEYDALVEQGKIYDVLAEKVAKYYNIKAAKQAYASEMEEVEKRRIEEIKDLYSEVEGDETAMADYKSVMEAINKGQLSLSDNNNLQSNDQTILQAANRIGTNDVIDILEAMRDKESLAKRVQDIFQVTNEELTKQVEAEAEKKYEAPDNRKNKADTEKAIKEQEAYYKKLQKLRQENGFVDKGGKQERVSDAMLESEKKNLDALIKSWEQMTGLKWDTSKKVKKEVDDIIKETERLSEAFSKQAHDNEKNSADAITNQYEKAIAQANLEYNLQKAELDKLAKEASENNKKRMSAGRLSSADVTTDTNGNVLTNDQNSILLTAYQNLEEGKTKAFKTATEEREQYYLSITDKYEAQRYEVRKKYQDMQDDLAGRKSRTTDTAEIASIDKAQTQIDSNLQNELFKIDFSEFQGSELYQKAFADLDRVGMGTLDQINAKLQEMEAQIPETMDPADIKAFQDAIRAVNDELISRNPLGAWVDSMERIKEARQEQEEAKKEIEASNTEVSDAKKDLKRATTDEQRAKATQKLTKATERQQKAVKKLEKADDKEAEAQDDANQARTEANSLMSEAEDVLGLIAEQSSGTTKQIITGIQTIFQVGQFGMQAMEMSAKVTAEGVKTVEKASVILAIIGAAIQLAMKVASLFSGKSSKDAYEESKATYEAYMDILDKVIDKQIELAESATATAGKSALSVAQDYYREALQLVEEQNEATRKIAQENLKARSRNAHSQGYRTFKENMTDEGFNQAWQKLQEAQLSQWASAYDFEKWLGMGGRIFSEMSDAQISALASSAEFMAHLDGDTRDYINSIAESTQKLKDIEMQSIEQTIGYSFDDLYEDWKDTISDMSGEGDTFAMTFGEKLRDAIIEAELQNTFRAQLDELANRQNRLMQGSSSDITPAEYESLLKDAKEIDEQIEAKRNELKEKYGFKDEASSEDQEATYGGFETMSEETGTELSGRFSAMQILQSEQLEVQQSALEVMTNVHSLLSVNNTAISEIRDMQILAVTHLSDMLNLHRRTFEEWGRRFENIETYTKNLE